MTAPSVEYAQLSPMLIIFGVAVAGVLAEAFLPRRIRYPAQLTLSLTGLAAAFVAVVMVFRNVRGLGSAAVGAGSSSWAAASRR